ncbi:hypothetical protein [Aliikangiella sp. G2MR2-5]|uniref:hypothetical protein n=1 Tax=Aliikangiella sp. G2MR2-5 TaxID=2788943 RepID=UPI0018A8DE69|nr:hypothetical protein [Aliikangiella sp. G2MR2-5]
MKRISLRGFGLLGIFLFLPLFLLTFADPQLIEISAKSFVEWKLNAETNKKIDSVQLPQENRFEKLLGNKAKELRNEAETKLARLKRQLKDDAPGILASEIAKMLNLDCECRKTWKNKIRESMELNIASLEKAKSKLVDFGQVKYMQIVEKLTLDVRIFLGTNSVIFVFLLLVSFFKPKAIHHLFLPGILMMISTIICSYFYIFEQNWFYTIIYNDYTGLGYLAYLMLVFAILSDIAFNKARVTTEILNTVFNAIGQAASLAPC